MHVTRLKKEILKRIPALCEQKNETLTVLSLDDENGRALLKASNNCWKKKKNDKDMIISKATKIIRKSMFKNVESFNGDFS